MNILVIGSGGREHTLAWKIKKSRRCEQLYVLPGNAGTGEIAQNIDISISDFQGIGQFVIENNIHMVVVGPEAPLVDGIRDYFEAEPALKNILFVGPGKLGAMLEGSKDFAKQFMFRHGIPTASYKTFSSGQISSSKEFIRKMIPPVVLKADGLAAGKGVIICNTTDEAEQVIDKMLLDEMFGKASSKVVVEEFLEGIEISIFLLTDGKNYVIFPEAKDYKRIGENDTGPNTGGMGSVSPVIFANSEFMKKVEDRIIKPTVSGLQKEHIDFKGFIFLGLMNMDGEPYVIEYNVRMGDPEAQVVIPRIKNDFVDLLESTASGNLGGVEISIEDKTAVTVVLASGGYPGSYEKGKHITGLDKIAGAEIFHAGTTKDKNDGIVTSGGRVLAITGKGIDLNSAIDSTYQDVAKIKWEGLQFRKDIGLDLLKLEN